MKYLQKEMRLNDAFAVDGGRTDSEEKMMLQGEGRDAQQLRLERAHPESSVGKRRSGPGGCTPANFAARSVPTARARHI